MAKSSPRRNTQLLLPDAWLGRIDRSARCGAWSRSSCAIRSASGTTVRVTAGSWITVVTIDAEQVSALQTTHDLSPISDTVGAWMVAEWLRLAAPYGAASISQDFVPITGATGWLKYLSKHASRGVAHYQRQGKPAGWESTGRLWGKGESGPRLNRCTESWMTRPSVAFAA